MTPAEINRRVAEACGLPPESIIDRQGEPDIALQPRIHKPFDPYHDANDALWAAERVCGGHTLDVSLDRTLQWYANVGGSIAYADTPTAAICHAILALKGATV